ncbi:hypothetical protein T12_5421, partial [Trichinella patagoniensis]
LFKEKMQRTLVTVRGIKHYKKIWILMKNPVLLAYKQILGIQMVKHLNNKHVTISTTHFKLETQKTLLDLHIKLFIYQ